MWQFLDRRIALTAAVLVLLGAIHTFLTWGHIGSFWGDQGRWLGDIDRHVAGENFYRDFFWPYPPMAIWLLGLVGHAFGTNVNVIWSATSAIFFLILIMFLLYSRDLVDDECMHWAAAPAVLFATALAQIGSAPLPMGMYSPAAPLGFLFLLTGVVSCWRGAQRGSLLSAVGAGAALAACVLSKQDSWIPAGAVLVGTRFLPTPLAKRQGARQMTVFLVCCGIGLAGIVNLSGWSNLASVFSGWGGAIEFRGRPYPSWQSIVVELLGLGVAVAFTMVLLLLTGAVSSKRMRKPLVVAAAWIVVALGIHCYASYRTGLAAREGVGPGFPTRTQGFMSAASASDRQLLRRSLVFVKYNLLRRMPPLFLPFLALGLLWVRRNANYSPRLQLLLFFGAVCCAARSRRLFEHAEWYNVFLEIPFYFAVLHYFFPAAWPRVSKAAGLTLLVLSLYWHNQLGVGLWTVNTDFRPIETPRGRIYAGAGHAAEYLKIAATLDAEDPQRKWPIFAFGFTGGHSYFLARPRPTPLTEGFFLSGIEPDRVIRIFQDLRVPFFLFDSVPLQKQGVPQQQLDFSHWDLQIVLNHHMRIDRPWFEKVLVACDPRRQLGETPVFLIYACGPRGGGPTSSNPPLPDSP